MSRNSTLVYSTDSGRICPECRKPVASCQCRQQAAGRPAPDGIVRIRRETKGRNGKGVTLIDGLPLSADELAALAKVLKNKCGSGGTVKDGVIEIQGEHREVVKGYLEQNGYKVKLAGG
ncbi:MAG: translation initiation factor Sui1 [Pseudohongiellaceae bacterium]